MFLFSLSNPSFAGSPENWHLRNADVTVKYQIIDENKLLGIGALDKKTNKFVLKENTAEIFVSDDAIKFITRGKDVLVGLYSRQNILLVSRNGTSWSTSRARPRGNITGIAYGKGIFIAVSWTGAIASSADGVEWVTRQKPKKGTTFEGISFGNDVFVAVSFGSAVAISNDGIMWKTVYPRMPKLAKIVFGKGVFVAAGGGTQKIFSSVDGRNWTVRYSAENPLHGDIAFGKDRFVTVVQDAEGCSIVTSSDGIVWKESTNLRKKWLRTVAYGNGMFVAVGVNGLMLTSPNGITWSERGSLTSMHLDQIIWADNRFNVPEGNGMMLSSADGVTWMKRPLKMPDGITRTVQGKNPFTAMAYGNSRYVAVRQGRIVTSSDGISWNESAPAGAQLRGIAYGKGIFVSVGERGTVLTSGDGISWVKRTSGSSSDDLSAVAFGNGAFLAAASGNLVLLSEDGITWNAMETDLKNKNLVSLSFKRETYCGEDESGSVSSTRDGQHWGGSVLCDRGRSISFVNNTFWAAFESGVLMTSRNGLSWDKRFLPQDMLPYRLIYGNGRYVALGNDGKVLVSRDGAAWSQATSGAASAPRQKRLYGRDVAYGNNVFVMTGPDSSLLTSTDGATWTISYTEANVIFYRILYAQGTFVAVGSNGRILTSPDGRRWSNRSVPIQETLMSIAHGNGTFVAVGNNNGLIVTSKDGVQWTRQASGNSHDYFSAVIFGNGAFIISGGDRDTYVSSDGITWKRTPSRGYQPQAYGNGMFISLGNYDSISISLDGITWEKKYIGSVVSKGFAYGNKLSVALNPDGDILVSPDEDSWTLVTPDPSPDNMQLSGVAYGKGRFVAIGPGGAILTTEDGTTWRLQHAGTTKRLTSIAYGNDVFVATGDSPNSKNDGYDGTVMTSSDGAAWRESSTGPVKSLYGATYRNGKFSIAEEGGRSLYSDDGLTWEANYLKPPGAYGGWRTFC
jgi:hypothetical protein